MDRPTSTPDDASSTAAPGEEQPAYVPVGGAAHTIPESTRNRAEFQFLLIALVLLMMIALAGVPGGADKQAGDGSDALRQGWAESHAATNPPIEQVEPTSESQAPADH